ncbi:UPF0420 protein C16orf58 [Morella rubra]|uniref:UPF0420 protein C16orf58 n=1 Tax=Morella rubra TaxID=262757 RepID=A0A6A1VBP0_9ROSI|nr:UPF0420 protein C16orf58 [Morella rubra]
MALFPPSSQELPPLPPPLVSPSKGLVADSTISGDGFSKRLYPRQAFPFTLCPSLTVFLKRGVESNICTLSTSFDQMQGFPSSVTPDYVPFQVWDSLQGLSTYIRTMLSTQALLSAIGVGEKSATVIGATFQWFLRDLTGMLGGILFTFYQGSNLDSNARMWRLVADLMNDLGMLMDLVSPLFPSAFVFVVCLGSLSRSFNLTVELLWYNASLNDWHGFGDSCCCLLMCMNHQKCFYTGYLNVDGPGYPLCLPSAFVFVVCLVACHDFCTGVASGATRAALTQHFALQSNAADIAAKEGSQETMATMIGMALGMLLARITMGHALAIWLSFLSLTMFHMYANYKAVRCLVLTSLNPQRSSILLQHFLETGQGMYLLVEKKGVVSAILHKDSTNADVLQSFFHALVLANFTDKNTSVHLQSQSWMDKHYEVFIQKLKSSGWKTERLLSPSIIWKANWICGPFDAKMD